MTTPTRSRIAKLEWYVRRASRMDAREIIGRAVDHVQKIALGSTERRIAERGAGTWVAQQFRPLPAPHASPTTWPSIEAVVEAADTLASGQLSVFEHRRSDLGGDFDWFMDPKSGLRAPASEPFRKINHRAWAGSAKHVWEPSRHQHLTVLAAARAVTNDERYADLVDSQLRSWWAANPPFRGFNWTSGIEIGVRLISWIWARRLLSRSESVGAIFDGNDQFSSQLYAHQTWLSRLPSRGSSGNNHAVAESAGLFVSACALPGFPESEQWLEDSRTALHAQIRAQVDADGLHRELSPDYHAFVAELFLLAAVEGSAAGVPFEDDYWQTLHSMLGALASMVDVAGNMPRQNDSDDAVGLMLDGDGFDRVGSLLDTGRAIFGESTWWPRSPVRSIRTHYLTEMFGSEGLSSEDSEGPVGVFGEAGMTILRLSEDGTGELWCKCDAGPLGYLETAAHGHADALSVEFHHDGVEVLADPGTYCYQHEPAWRSYFRSTAAHNTIEIVGAPQAREDGPFIWKPLGRAKTLDVTRSDNGSPLGWVGEFEYGEEIARTRHVRKVNLGPGSLSIIDEIHGEFDVVMRFHLGPGVSCSLEGHEAQLSWRNRNGHEVLGRLELPGELAWTEFRGSEDPILGWYSPHYGVREPTTTLQGEGRLRSRLPVETSLSITATQSGIENHHK